MNTNKVHGSTRRLFTVGGMCLMFRPTYKFNIPYMHYEVLFITFQQGLNLVFNTGGDAVAPYGLHLCFTNLPGCLRQTDYKHLVLSICIETQFNLDPRGSDMVIWQEMSKQTNWSINGWMFDGWV